MLIVRLPALCFCCQVEGAQEKSLKCFFVVFFTGDPVEVAPPKGCFLQVLLFSRIAVNSDQSVITSGHWAPGKGFGTRLFHGFLVFFSREHLNVLWISQSPSRVDLVDLKR